MKYLLLIGVMVLSIFSSLQAEVDYMPYLGREIDKINIYNPHKSNWVTTFGFEAQGLPIKRDYQGQRKSFTDKDELLAGARLGIGRDFYLGKGFVTKTLVEGYFVGTLFEPKKRVTDEDKEASNSYTQKQGNVWGGEVTQTLSYVTEFNAPTFVADHKIKMFFEPFIEAGIGMGKSYFNFDYKMKSSTTNEDYKTVMDNTFVSQKFSVGMNFISRTGYFFTMKASQVAHQVTDSKSYETRNAGGSSSRRDLDQKDDTINLSYSYYLGGGYKW